MSTSDDIPPTTRSRGAAEAAKNEETRTKVLHIDRDAVFRACLAAIATEFCILDKDTPIADVDPSLILIEVSDPQALQVASRFRTLLPTVPVVALSANGDEFRVGEALAAGCSGYLLKREPVASVLAGVREAVRGGQPTSASLSGALLSAMHRRRFKSATGLESLTDREKQVVRRLCEGRTPGEAAMDLGISSKTIDTHRAHIYKKTGIRSLVELCRAGIRSGFININA